MMATKDMRAYDLDDEFDQLIRDIDFEDVGDAVQCAEKAPTTKDGLVMAAVEGSDREAIGGAGSCHEPVLMIQHKVMNYNMYMCIYKGQGRGSVVRVKAKAESGSLVATGFQSTSLTWYGQ